MSASGIAILRNIDTVARSIQAQNDVLVFFRKWQLPPNLEAVVFGVGVVCMGLAFTYRGFAPIVPHVQR